MLHNLLSLLPANWPQWLGVVLLLLLHSVAHFYLSRTHKVRASNLVELVANAIMDTPGVGALVKATPLLGTLLQYLDTPDPAPAVAAVAAVPPLPLPPAAVVVLAFWGAGLAHAASRCLLVLAVVTSMSCALTKKIAIDAGACALNSLPAAVVGIVPDVRNILGTSGTDAQSTTAIENLAIQYGWATVTCAIEAAISDVVNAKKLGRALPEDEAVVRRGRVLLSHKHVDKPASSLLDRSLRGVKGVFCALGRLL